MGKDGKVFTFKGNKVDKITKDTFYCEQAADNAEIFVDSLKKSRAHHLKKIQEKELGLVVASDEGSDNLENSGCEGSINSSHSDDNKKGGEAGVIMDLNPEKYEKPKDYLFFDFFSMYAKNFISQKNGGSRDRRTNNI